MIIAGDSMIREALLRFCREHVGISVENVQVRPIKIIPSNHLMSDMTWKEILLFWLALGQSHSTDPLTWYEPRKLICYLAWSGNILLEPN